MSPGWIRPLFRVAALYDLILGVVYFVAYRSLYERFGIALPNHPGYVHMPAAMIVVFGIGFWFVSRAPRRNRDLIKLGILMKLGFAGVVFGHLLFGSIPSMWVPFAVIDLVFAAAFVAALGAIPAEPARA